MEKISEIEIDGNIEYPINNTVMAIRSKSKRFRKGD